MTSRSIIDSTYGDITSQTEKLAKELRHIPQELFSDIRKWSNTPTADIIPTRYGYNGFEFLLGRRLQKPWAGNWFFFGGRIFPGLTPEDGMVTVCKRELGFMPKIPNIQFLLWQSIMHPENEHGEEAYFTMSGCWQVWIDHDEVLSLDDNHSEMRCFTKSEIEQLPFYVQQAVRCLRLNPARDAALSIEG